MVGPASPFAGRLQWGFGVGGLWGLVSRVACPPDAPIAFGTDSGGVNPFGRCVIGSMGGRSQGNFGASIRRASGEPRLKPNQGELVKSGGGDAGREADDGRGDRGVGAKVGAGVYVAFDEGCTGLGGGPADGVVGLEPVEPIDVGIKEPGRQQ